MTGHNNVWNALYEAWSAGETSGLATVVRTFGSAPRLAGLSMLLTAEGHVVGSVSGGCVEGDVLERARETILNDTPQRATYGISDNDAFGVGLTCGGTLEVFVEPINTRTFGASSPAAASISSTTAHARSTDCANNSWNSSRHLKVPCPGRAGGRLCC
ncbi:hypothetical protein B1R27_15945 [Streptomyces sp. GKU 895]|nr:hypothetical protein B1R27_15945 [Streptomyces sp. GKU 895]